MKKFITGFLCSVILLSLFHIGYTKGFFSSKIKIYYGVTNIYGWSIVDSVSGVDPKTGKRWSKVYGGQYSITGPFADKNVYENRNIKINYLVETSNFWRYQKIDVYINPDLLK